MKMPSNLKNISIGSHIVNQVEEMYKDDHTVKHVVIMNPTEGNLIKIIRILKTKYPGIQISVLDDDGDKMILNKNLL